MIGAIYMGKIPISGYVPMTDIPGYPSPDFLLLDASKRKAEDDVTSSPANKKMKTEDGSSKLSTTSVDLAPSAMSDEFTDVQGVSIGDWNHVHGINDIDPSSGKKKRR